MRILTSVNSIVFLSLITLSLTSCGNKTTEQADLNIAKNLSSMYFHK